MFQIFVLPCTTKRELLTSRHESWTDHRFLIGTAGLEVPTDSAEGAEVICLIHDSFQSLWWLVPRSSTGAGTNSTLSSVSQWNQDDWNNQDGWNNLIPINPDNLVQEFHAEPLDYR